MTLRLQWIALSVLSVFALLFAVVASVPHWRQAIRDYFLAHDRNVLARADGSLKSAVPGQFDEVAVIKVQTTDSLSLEIYAKSSDSDQLVFQKRIILPEKRDGYFTFRGNATNLVLTDLDGDGGAEILAPTFDENLIPRLNIYKYLPDSQSFQKLGPESFGKN
jgi:hypothetical protein